MVRHIIAMIILSLLMVLGLAYYRQALQLMVKVHASLVRLLGHVFSGGNIGHLIQHSLALLFIPLIVGVIVGIIYWGVRKSQWPYVVHLAWIVWVILATSLACRLG